jgi:hypothetical protein
MDNFYPTVEAGSLVPVSIIFAGLASDPLWLERKACPYDPATRAEIQAVWASARLGHDGHAKSAPAQQGEELPLSDVDLERDLNRLHHELIRAKTDADTEGKGDLGYFRVAVALMDKIVGLRERLNGVRAISDFRNLVFKVFEEVLTPDQRTKAITILENNGNGNAPK